MNKMTPKNSIWIFILKWVVIIGVFCLLLVNISINHHRTQMYAAIIEIPIYFFAILIFIVTCVYDCISIYKNKNYLKLTPSITTILLIVFGVYIFSNTHKKIFKQNKYVAYTKDYDFFKVDYSIDFKVDNSFVANHYYTSYTYHHYGTYQKKGNYLFLSGELNTNGLCRKMKIVSKYSEKDPNKLEYELIPLGSSNNKIRYSFKYLD